jgi:hypothetical protein
MIDIELHAGDSDHVDIMHSLAGFFDAGVHSGCIDVHKAISFAKRARKGGGMRVQIHAIGDNKTRQQENYYRKCCRLFADFCGMYPDEMHDEMLAKCFGSKNVTTKLGPIKRPMVRSTDLTQSEYSKLIDCLTITAGELGFAVPPPMKKKQEAGE